MFHTQTWAWLGFFCCQFLLLLAFCLLGALGVCGQGSDSSFSVHTRQWDITDDYLVGGFTYLRIPFLFFGFSVSLLRALGVCRSNCSTYARQRDIAGVGTLGILERPTLNLMPLACIGPVLYIPYVSPKSTFLRIPKSNLHITWWTYGRASQRGLLQF